MNPQYKIRKLNERIKDLETLCHSVHIPLLVVYFPQLVLKKYQRKPTKKEVQWAKDKIAEFKEKFPQKNPSP